MSYTEIDAIDIVTDMLKEAGFTDPQLNKSHLVWDDIVGLLEECNLVKIRRATANRRARSVADATQDNDTRGTLDNSDHTPGPWWPDDDGCIAAGSGGTDNYKTICQLIDADMTPFEAQSNAVLIEMAPEMYKALQEIRALGGSNPEAARIAWTHLFRINEAQLAIDAEPVTPTYPLTDEQYVKAGSMTCPFCGSTDTTSDIVDTDGSNDTQRAWCYTCGMQWKVLYDLVGYEPVRPEEWVEP